MAITERTNQDGSISYAVWSGGHYGGTFRDDKAAAQQAERDLKSARYHGEPVIGRGGTRTFADIAEEWLASNLKKAEGSIEKDRGNLANHICPTRLEGWDKTFGEMRIGQITKKDVQELVNSWWPPRFANETVRRSFSTLRAVFTYAVDNNYLVLSSRIDPCRRITLPPRKPRKAPIPYTQATRRGEQPKIDLARLEQLSAHLGPYECMPLLALNGPRWGEIAGLQVGDINFGEGVERTIITINRQLTRGTKGRMVLKDTLKSENEMEEVQPRAFSVGPWLADKLWDHIGPRGIDPEAFVFTTADPAWLTDPKAQGRRWSRQNVMLHYSNWRLDYWVPARKAADFPDLQFKDLRKIATHLLEGGGVGVKTRERRLGNTIDVQNSVYLRATDPDDWSAGDYVDNLLAQADHQRPQI